MSGHLYIITGPSGVGKTTVAMALQERRETLKKVTTCTTRPIRDGEVDGTSYHFLDRATFQELIDQNKMFEWDEHYGNFYGSRKSDVEAILATGNSVLFVVDVQGAINIQKTNPEAIVLFLEPESSEQLVDRIQKRDGGDTIGFEERTKSVEREMAYKPQADHSIMNKEGELEVAVNQILSLMTDLDAKA
jgi:guanylate kinase